MLYIVGTPIGNLKDISSRALETLGAVDFIACEDTRHSRILLDRYGIKKPLISYYKHKERESAEKILLILNENKSVALITDAGMPCVSDPGSVLINRARESGIDICVIPGPTAVSAAVSLAGLCGGFVFLGFLAEKLKDKKAQLAPFVCSPLPIVLYSAPHDMEKTAAFLYQELGERKLTVVKELTKIYEGVELTTLSQGTQKDIKGEYVLIVEGMAENVAQNSDVPVEERLSALINAGYTKKEAVKKVAEERKVKRDDIYKIALKMKT